MSGIIAPSILSADYTNLERDVKLVEAAGAEYLHIVYGWYFCPPNPGFTVITST
ncbi:hypothetical protein KQ236_14070 [Lactococcus lactis]|nr:hypothetical protein [Lactococcus lactis]